MKKQTIEISCPDEMTAVFDQKNMKIKFVPKRITSYKEACEVLGITENANVPHIIELQTIVKALNLGHEFSLTEGTVYYPIIRFIKKSVLKNRIYFDELAIQDFKYKGEIYTLVGGGAGGGGVAGLGCFGSDDSVAWSLSLVGFLGCKDLETAQYLSKQFGKLIFMALVGHRVEGIEWL